MSHAQPDASQTQLSQTQTSQHSQGDAVALSEPIAYGAAIRQPTITAAKSIHLNIALSLLK